MNRTLTRPETERSAPTASGFVPAGSYHIREATPDDASLIREFVRGLSVRTQYLRFFTAVSPSPGLLRALSEPSGRADILLATDGFGAIVGHGMAVQAEKGGRLVADVGLVVADSWQGQGLGTTLLTMLTDRAAERGVSELVLDVLPVNDRMLGIIERRWPDARRKRTPDAITITADIRRDRLVSPAISGRVLAAALLDCAGRASYRAGRYGPAWPAA